MNDMRKFLDIFNESEISDTNSEDTINVYDNFDIEISETLVIETSIVGITDDGDILVEGDEEMLGILELNTVITEADDISEKMVMGASTDASASGTIGEAEYQGRKVPLGKPMRNTGGGKKSKVYVRDPKTGNIRKITFGDPNMRIKKSSPERRKSFRARHKCDTAKDRTTARYWSCRAW